MAIPKKVIITVNGVPFQQLSIEHQEKIIHRNTELTEKTISNQVMRMIKSGRSEKDIQEFLGI